MRTRLRDGAPQLRGVGPRVAEKLHVERLIWRMSQLMPSLAVASGPFWSDPGAFGYQDLIGLAQQDGREPTTLAAEVLVEDGNPKIARNGAGNAVENLGRLTCEKACSCGGLVSEVTIVPK